MANPPIRLVRAARPRREPLQSAQVTSPRNDPRRWRSLSLFAPAHSISSSSSRPRNCFPSPVISSCSFFSLQASSGLSQSKPASSLRCLAARALGSPRRARWPRRPRSTEVGQHQFRIEPFADAQSAARRARAIGTVEAERSRLDFRHAGAAVRAGKLGAEYPLVPLVGLLAVVAKLVNDFQHAIAVLEHSRTDSAKRASIPSRTTMRSTTAAMSCVLRAPSSGISSIGYVLPSTRTRAKPALRADSRTSVCLPLRPRTSGATIITRDSTGMAAIACSISAGLCCWITVLHSGQASDPARLNNTRK